MLKNKSIIYFILLILVVSSVSATNVSLNYVWDGTDWIPWLATADGRPKIDLNKVNVTAGKLVVDTNLLYVDEVNDFIGFRTAAPAATLDVIGNISVRGGVLFVDNESQRVGINTTTPTAELHVIGDVNISGRLDVGILNISGVTFAGGNIDTGNITADYFLGDASLMSGLTNASVNYGWNGSSNVPYKLSGDGTLQMSIDNDIADDLACTDCIGATEITDVYVLNTGDFVDGTLGVGGVLNATGLNITGTEENATFMGDVQIMGTLYGGSPLKVSGGINVTDGNITTTGRITGDHKKELVADMNMTLLLHFNNDSSVGEDFNTSNGSIIYDYSNKEANGTLYGNDAGVTYLPSGGMFGGAYEFDGADAYVHVTGVCQTDIILWDEGTVSLWFKGNAFSYLDDDYLFSMSDNEFTLSFSTGNDLKFNIYDGSTYVSVNSTTTNFQTDKWHHVAVTYGSTGGMELYLNGVYEASNSFTATPRPDCTQDHDRLVIGNTHTPDFGYKGFNGTIDEFAIWNRTLSADEILNVYKKGFANVVEGSTLFDEEVKVNDNLVVHGNLSGDGDLIINPNGGNVGIGTIAPTSELHVIGDGNFSGDVYVMGNISTFGADFAEMFESDELLEPGEVVCLKKEFNVTRCSQRADPLVMGVVSADPTIAGNNQLDDAYPIGVVGIVPTKVKGPLEKGNLLTTSSLAGYAEKATVEDFGAIIGKAMDSCEEECKINVLVGLR